MKTFFSFLFIVLLGAVLFFAFGGSEKDDLVYEEVELEEEVFKRMEPLPSKSKPSRKIASIPEPTLATPPVQKKKEKITEDRKAFDQLNDLRKSSEFSKSLAKEEKTIEEKESWLRSYSETMLEAIKLTLTDSEEEQAAFDELTDYIGELFDKQSDKDIAKINNNQMVAAIIPKGGMERLQEMTN